MVIFSHYIVVVTCYSKGTGRYSDVASPVDAPMYAHIQTQPDTPYTSQHRRHVDINSLILLVVPLYMHTATFPKSTLI